MIKLVDLVPTLLEIIGLSPIADCDGNSLLSLINGRSLSSYNEDVRLNHRSIFSESTSSGNLKISLIEYPYKFIYAYKEVNALFNLEEDHKESKNLVNEKLRLASDMLKKLLRFKEDKPPQTEEISLSKEELEKLQILGYIDNGK